ncbi:MAG: hypothetical protein LBD47_03150 [Treponema sp.]|jgi:uracil phosphoribosyltransferase|nr:hypothetical protein [Treponema sp.]
MMLEQSMSSTQLEQLRNRINDEDYLREAIQRIAQVLSNELLDTFKEKKYDGRRKKRG